MKPEKTNSFRLNKSAMAVVAILALSTSTVFAQEAPFPGTIESRRDWVMNDLANRPKYNTVTPSTLGICVAKLQKGVDTEWALNALRQRLENPTDDALQMHQGMHAYLLVGKDHYTPEMIKQVETRFRGHDYDEPNFCSDNFVYSHWATGYMVGEQFPDVEDKHGRKGDELATAMKEKLFDRYDDIVNRGFGEFGSVNYAHHTYDATRMLAEHAKDPDMKKRSKMILDWLWVNWALDWHNGYLVTASSRDKNIQYMHSSPSNLAHHALAAWVYLGAHRPVEDFGGASGDHRDGYNYWALYEGDYSPPEIALDIGKTSQNTAYESRKRSWYDMCHKEMRINRTAFLKPNWGLASMNFRNIDRSWQKEGNHIALKWDSPHAANLFWVAIDNDHISYLTGDEQWSHRIMQHKGTAVGTFSAQGDLNDMLAAFTKTGAIEKKVEADGWIFCHTGVNLFAFRTVKSNEWADDHDKYNVLKSTHDKNGWILETADLDDYAGEDVDEELDAFKRDVLENASVDDSHIDSENPSLIYRSIHGYTMDNTWYDLSVEENRYFQVNGTPIDYESYKQIDSPWVSQEINSGIMTLNHEGKTVVYNFNDWTVSGDDCSFAKHHSINKTLDIAEWTQQTNE